SGIHLINHRSHLFHHLRLLAHTGEAKHNRSRERKANQNRDEHIKAQDDASSLPKGSQRITCKYHSYRPPVPASISISCCRFRRSSARLRVRPLPKNIRSTCCPAKTAAAVRTLGPIANSFAS